MKTKKVLIVGTDSIVLKNLQTAIKSINYTVQAIASSNKKAFEAIEKTRPDIVIMDIDIKGKIKGIESAGLIKSNYQLPVIFTFNPDDESIITKLKTTEPLGFLLKPLKTETLPQELEAIFELSLYRHEREMLLKKENELYISLLSGKAKHDGIFVRANYMLNHIKYSDILYIEAFKDYVVIHTIDKSYTTHATMKEMVKVLPPKDFVRVHRSHIVKLDKIVNIKYPEMEIEGKKQKIQIGGMYRKELYNRLNIL